MLLAASVGITLGVVAAVRPHGAVDRFSMLLAYVGVSFPVYWVGLLLILLFAVTLQWLPPSGYGGGPVPIIPAPEPRAGSISVLAPGAPPGELRVRSSDFLRTRRGQGGSH